MFSNCFLLLLGPVRRPYQYQPAQKKKPPVFARPKTAPSKQEAGAGQLSRSEPVSRPMSSRSLNNNKAKQPQDKDICDPEEIDTDELFHAISELIFPTGRLDSDESILAEDECSKYNLNSCFLKSLYFPEVPSIRKPFYCFPQRK